ELPCVVQVRGAGQLAFPAKLTPKRVTTFYVVWHDRQLSVRPIEGDPVLPNDPPLVRSVNLTDAPVSFTVVGTTSVELSSPAAGKGGDAKPASTGKLATRALSGGKTLLSGQVDATKDNAFSAVAYLDRAGAPCLALVTNCFKPGIAAGGAARGN